MTKWWFEKVGGRRTPTTPAQSIGLAIHERAENFIRTGSWGFPDDDPIVQLVKPGQSYLEDMRRGYMHRGGEVEKLYEIPKGEWPVPVFCRTDYVEHDYGLVVDHKSTKDIYSQWIPTPFDLAKNDQMLWYGYLEWRNDPNPPESYEVQHTYFSSQAPASRVVRVRTTWEKTLVVAKKFGEIARTMFDASQILQPEELEYNLDACGDFRGCPHQDYCPHVKGTSGGLSTLRAKLKRSKTKADSRPQPQHEEKTTMGFRDRRKKQLEEAAVAEKTEETVEPTPGEGQGNPPDSPGTEDPTEAQLEEVCDGILEELGPEASNADITVWLTGDGNETLIRAGLGRPHVPRILRYWSGTDGVEEAATPDADQADASEAETPSETSTSDVVDGDEHPLVTFLRDNGGKMKVNDKALAKIIRELTGIGRLTHQARTEFLAELNDQGLVDFNTVHVFLPELTSELGGGADARREASEPEPSKPKSGKMYVAGKPKKSPDLKIVEHDVSGKISSIEGMTLLVGCLPSSGLHSFEIDDVLHEYYTAAHDAAVDESGNKVDDLLLWAYGKGPKTVAALVRGDVLDGSFKWPESPVYVPRDHFMAPHLKLMFPNAVVIRGV